MLSGTTHGSGKTKQARLLGVEAEPDDEDDRVGAEDEDDRDGVGAEDAEDELSGVGVSNESDTEEGLGVGEISEEGCEEGLDEIDEGVMAEDPPELIDSDDEDSTTSSDVVSIWDNPLAAVESAEILIKGPTVVLSIPDTPIVVDSSIVTPVELVLASPEETPDCCMGAPVVDTRVETEYGSIVPTKLVVDERSEP